MAQRITQVTFHGRFKKSYKKRIKTNKSAANKFAFRYKTFIKNRSNSILKDHKLAGELSKLRSFSITSDIRVVYRLKSPELAEFIDIGTHNQIYG